MSEPRTCAGTRTDGSPCQSQLLLNGSMYCYPHSPEVSDAEKHEARSRGGYANAPAARVERSLRANPSLQNVISNLGAVTDAVIDGTLSPSQGSAVASLAKSMVMIAQLAEASQKLAALEALVDRLDALGLEDV